MLKKFGFILMFLLLFLSNTLEVQAGFVDIGGIYNGFSFSEDVNNDMEFSRPEKSNNDDFWNLIYGKFKVVIMLFFGIICLVLVAFFIINITKYGASAGNSERRKASMISLLWLGIAAALTGGMTIFIGFSTNLFK